MTTSTRPETSRRKLIVPWSLRPVIQSYVEHSASQGYRPLSIRFREAQAKHFSFWLDRSGIAIDRVDEAVIDQFAHHTCCCPGSRQADVLSRQYVFGVRKFVDYLARAGVIQRSERTSTDDPTSRRIAAYVDWIRQHRGLSENTIREYRKLLVKLLSLLGVDAQTYNIARIRKLFVTESRRCGTSHMKNAASALRSYLRYLALRGECPPALFQAVPSVAHWKQSHVPKFLPAAQVQVLIGSCDTTAAAGIRDRAILLLLARLGLRASDIAKLRVGDIDWQQGTLRVCGKGRRQSSLPLPQDAGDAVLRYLTEARPDVPVEQIFLSVLAPYRPLATDGTVSSIVRRNLTRAGIDDAPSRGAHQLRHSAATAMLHAGATLAVIGTVLRHRSIDTTGQYAKVDFAALRHIAQPWPGGESC